MRQYEAQTRTPLFPRPAYSAYLALAFGIFCIGFSAIFVKLAGVPGPVSALYRMVVASCVLVPWWSYRRAVRPSRADISWIAAGGAFFALDLALWNTSLMLTSAASASLLANNAPVWVGLASLLLFRERLTSRYWAGLLIALVGMAVLLGEDAWRGLGLNTGNLLALAASGFYSAYLLTTQRVRARSDTLTFTTISVLASTVVLLGMNLVIGSTLSGFSLRTWAALLGLGLVTHVGGWLSINYSLGHLRAASVSVTLLGQVIVTALLAIPLLGEGLSLGQVLGGALVLGSIYLVNEKR